MGLTRPTVSQLNTVVTEISDPVSVLNKGSTLANIDVGFVLNRDGGISSNAAIIWQESSDQFVLGLTTSTGAVFANIVVSEYANLRVNQLTGTLATAAQPNITSVGNLTSLAASGNISTTGYLFGNGSQLTGIITSVTRIVNGTSNITAYEDSNIAVTVGGTSNTAIFTTSGITVSGNISASYFTGSGTALTGINSFGNVFVSGQNPVLADNTSDTLTLVGGSGIAITTDAANDSVTISTVSTEGPFATSGDFGTVIEAVTVSEDEGLVTDSATITYDLGSIISASGLVYPDLLVLPTYTSTTLPSVAIAGQLVYQSNTQLLGYSTGTAWANVISVINGDASVSGNITTSGLTVTSNITVNGTAGIIMPARPGFRIYGSGVTANQSTSNVNLKGSVLTVDYNQGSYFNSTTGQFTVPVAGLYQVYLVARVGNNNGLNQIAVLKNGLNNAGNVMCFWETDTNAGVASHFGTGSVVKLGVGDYLSANILAGQIQFDQNDSWSVTYLG